MATDKCRQHPASQLSGGYRTEKLGVPSGRWRRSLEPRRADHEGLWSRSRRKSRSRNTGPPRATCRDRKTHSLRSCRAGRPDCLDVSHRLSGGAADRSRATCRMAGRSQSDPERQVVLLDTAQLARQWLSLPYRHDVGLSVCSGREMQRSQAELSFSLGQLLRTSYSSESPTIPWRWELWQPGRIAASGACGSWRGRDHGECLSCGRPVSAPAAFRWNWWIRGARLLRAAANASSSAAACTR